MSSMPIDYDNVRLWENCCGTVVLALLTTYCLSRGNPATQWYAVHASQLVLFTVVLLTCDLEVYFFPHGRRDGSVAAETKMVVTHIPRLDS
eukprot:13344151-Ditylum_brightwellii.AAC.1